MLRRVENALWEALFRGLSHREAGASVGLSQAAVSAMVRSTGGVRPRVVLVSAVDTEGRPRYLTELEREHIALRRAAGVGVRAIARELGRDPATVSREIRRNGFTRSGYHPDGSPRGSWQYRGLLAQKHAEQRRRRPKTRKLAASPRLAAQVQTRLDQRWSPRQIARTLPHEFPRTRRCG